MPAKDWNNRAKMNDCTFQDIRCESLAEGQVQVRRSHMGECTKRGRHIVGALD